MDFVNVVASDWLPRDTIALFIDLKSTPSTIIRSTSKGFVTHVINLELSMDMSIGASSLRDRKPGTVSGLLTGGTICQ